MPDLLSHSLAAYALGRIQGDRTTAGYLVMGALLPDVLSHAPSKMLEFATRFAPVPRQAFYLFEPFHSPFFLLAACLFIAFLFKDRVRGAVAACLVQGAFLHLFMDLFQRQMDGGYMLLFPFSTSKLQFGLWWGDLWPYWAATFFLAALLTEWAKGRSARRAGGAP